MEKTIKTTISLKRAVQLAVVILTLFFLLAMWPLQWIKHSQTFGSLDTKNAEFVQSEGQIMQKFIPRATGLTYLTIYLGNEEIGDDDYFVFRLFNENMELLDKRNIFLEKLNLPGECRILVNSELTAGSVYYFTLENAGVELLAGVRSAGDLPEEAQEAGFSGVEDIETALDIEFVYHNPLSVKRLLFYSVCGLMLCAALCFVAEKGLGKNCLWVRADACVRIALTVLVLGVALWTAWQVFPARRFSVAAVDIVFYEVGLLLFAVFSLYGLLHRREVRADRIALKECAAKIPGILQTLAFVVALRGATMYVNALSNHEQAMGRGTLLIGFALVILCGFEKKEIINWYNAVYLPIAGFFAWRYASQAFDTLQQADEAGVLARAYFLWGFVALNAIRVLFYRKKQKISIVYTAAMVLLFAELIRSRNVWTWPVDIAVFWGLFAIRIICKGSGQAYLRRFSDGVFIHYICISIYAMLYRPFHYFYYIRYPGIFHTVTMAAVYFMLVLGLALVRFLAVYRERGSLKKCWKEICLMGMAFAQLILTTSRTGLLAMAVLIPALLILTAVAEFKDGIKGFLKRFCIVVGSGALFFPVLFTAYRIIPAVVSNPYTYEIEWFAGSVEKGEEWDSLWFATVPRFFGVAQAKVSYYGSTEEITAEQEAMGADADYSNGRIDIFKAYIANLDWKGHDTVGLLQENGETIVHAHNSFIQTAYDFGLGAGIFFLLFCIFAGVRSIFYYKYHKDEENGLVPLMVLAIFGVCGMVERVFFPYYAIGFAFLTVLVLLVPKLRQETVKQEGQE